MVVGLGGVVGAGWWRGQCVFGGRPHHLSLSGSGKRRALKILRLIQSQP